MKSKKPNKIIVYLVGHQGPEHDYVEGVYRNYEDALVTFEKIRLDLLKDAEKGLKYAQKESRWSVGMYKEIIKKLGEKDPKKIDNYPQETPYIKEQELK